MSPGLFHPVAANDVAQIVAEVGVAGPLGGVVEKAGPEGAAA